MFVVSSVEIREPPPICVICQHALDSAIQTICFHFFHEGCLGLFLEQQDHCPLCKTVFIVDEELPHLPTERVERLFRQILSGPNSTEQLHRIFQGISRRPSLFDRQNLLTQGLDEALSLSPTHIPLFFQNLGPPRFIQSTRELLLQSLKNAIVQRQTQSLAYLFLEAADMRSPEQVFFVRNLKTTFPEREIHLYLRRSVIPAIRELPETLHKRRALAIAYSIPRAIPLPN